MKQTRVSIYYVVLHLSKWFKFDLIFIQKLNLQIYMKKWWSTENSFFFFYFVMPSWKGYRIVLFWDMNPSSKRFISSSVQILGQINLHENLLISYFSKAQDNERFSRHQKHQPSSDSACCWTIRFYRWVCW